MKLKSYPKYKDSGIQWIGEIPEGWEVRKLKFLLSTPVTDGPHESPEFIDKGIPFLSVDSIQDGEIIFEGCRYISEEDYIKYKVKCNPQKNDVFMGKAASIGKIARVKVDFTFSIWSPLALLRANKKIKSQFLEYALKSDYSQDQIDIFATSNTQKNISMDDIPKIQLILPRDINNQQKIASFLDKKTSEINKTIEKDKKLIALLNEKRTALINHAVTKGLDPNVKLKDSGIQWIGEIPEGWGVRKIGKLSNVSRGASPRPIDDSKYFDEDGEYSWVRIADVTASDKYLLETTEKLSVLGKSLSVPLEQGRLFISIAGTVGKPMITRIKCCIHDGFVYFKNLEVNQEYLYYIFIGGQAYLGLGKLGTQLNLNTETIGLITIPLPPKPEQEKIVEYLDKATSKIDKTIKLIEKKIKLLEEYKKSLIYYVVTGKVDVRGVA